MGVFMFLKLLSSFFILSSLSISFLYAETNNVEVYVHESEFKTAIAKALKDKLKDYDVELLDIKDLSTADPVKNHAIVVINQTQWLKPNKEVLKFVDSLNEEQKSKVFVLSTAGTKGKNIKVPGVDAITSASEMSRVGEISQSIADKVSAL